jgi:hypothetical protein
LDTNVLEELAASIFRVKRMVLGKGGKYIGLECKKGRGVGNQCY